MTKEAKKYNEGKAASLINAIGKIRHLHEKESN